jgi:hypothetical protein
VAKNLTAIFISALLLSATISAEAAVSNVLSQQEILQKDSTLYYDPVFERHQPQDFKNYLFGEVIYFYFNDRKKVTAVIDMVHKQRYNKGFKVNYYPIINYNNNNYITFILTRSVVAYMCPGNNKTEYFDYLSKREHGNFFNKTTDYFTNYVDDDEDFSNLIDCSYIATSNNIPSNNKKEDPFSSSNKFSQIKGSTYVNSISLMLYFSDKYYGKLKGLVSRIDKLKNLSDNSIPYYSELIYNNSNNYKYTYYIYVTVPGSCVNQSILDSFFKLSPQNYIYSPYATDLDPDTVVKAVDYYINCNQSSNPGW